jgi:hypothetical protein
MNLYDIGAEWVRLMDAVADSGGELSAEAEQALAEIDLADAKKVDGYCCVIRGLEARAKARGEEGRRIGQLAQADDNAARRLKLRLKEHLERTGRKRVDTDRFRVWVQASPASVVVDPNVIAALPEQFRRTVTEIKPDAAALIAAAKAGEELPAGVQIVQSTHLRIH